MRKRIACWLLILGGAACSKSAPVTVVITATFEPSSVPAGLPATSSAPLPALPLSPVPEQLGSNPTPDPPRNNADPSGPEEYVVQPGDTLYGIALSNNISLQALLADNQFADPDVLSVGQVVNIPGAPKQKTPDFKIIPDSRLVRAPGSAHFEVAAFVSQQPGYIRDATDNVPTNMANGLSKDETLTAAQVIQRVAIEFSVDPRLLLALLEYRAHWLSQSDLSDDAKQFPMISEEASGQVDRSGLYRQLAWTADQLNLGYYSWKYDRLTTLEFDDGTRLRYAPGLNAGTVAIQYFLSLHSAPDLWATEVTQIGFFHTFYAYFGDPFVGAIDPLVPPDLVQPPMILPFPQGETWFFTGGPHGGWGNGSAWAAIDFAPPDERSANMPACYQSEYWATAVAPGLIVRSDQGMVLLDLDGDGDETTGWVVMYLHLSSDGRVPVGTLVQPGDHIGHPSCEGGVSTATHMHIARRYNGEWIPAACPECTANQQVPPLVLSGWVVGGYARQVYQGYLRNGAAERTAQQGRNSPDNRVSW